jgi:hypothetical protein
MTLIRHVVCQLSLLLTRMKGHRNPYFCASGGGRSIALSRTRRMSGTAPSSPLKEIPITPPVKNNGFVEVPENKIDVVAGDASRQKFDIDAQRPWRDWVCSIIFTVIIIGVSDFFIRYLSFQPAKVAAYGVYGLNKLRQNGRLANLVFACAFNV